MASTRNPGRVAGLWYLALTILGPLRLIYIPGKPFVSGNAAATVDNIAASSIFGWSARWCAARLIATRSAVRLGFASSMVCIYTTETAPR